MSHRIQLVVVKHQSIFVYNVRSILPKNEKIGLCFFLDGPIVRLNGGGILAENKRLILTCIVDAYPSIDSYQWYKNDQKINVSSLTSSLIIDKVSKYDTGIYTCLAKNTLKYSNGSTIEKFDKTQTHVTVECKKNKSKIICEVLI